MNDVRNSSEIPSPVANAAFEAWILPALAFLLFGAPKLRLVMAGIPLYAVDGLVAVLVARVVMRPPVRMPAALRPFMQLTLTLGFLIFFSELRGAVAYVLPAAWIYMAARFLLAAALVYVVPVYTQDIAALSRILKGAILGLMLSAGIAILYSFGPTRPLVLKTVLSWSFICPDTEALISKTTGFYGLDATIRGRSLIGAATFTSGVLAAGWPLIFVLSNVDRDLGKAWRLIVSAAGVLIPVGVLATYGRAAWLSVVFVVLGMLSLRVRGATSIGVLGVAVVAGTLVYSPVIRDSLMVERVATRAQGAIDAPLKEVGDRERFDSYIEPFFHAAEHPSWLLVGAGRSGARLGRSGRGVEQGQIYDERKRATHSAFAIGYYSFGLLAAVCNMALLVLVAGLLRKRIRMAGPKGGQVWRSFVLVWLGFLPWWMFGHGSVGEPRGSMVFFILYGLVLAYAKVSDQRETRVEG